MVFGKKRLFSAVSFAYGLVSGFEIHPERNFGHINPERKKSGKISGRAAEILSAAAFLLPQNNCKKFGYMLEYKKRIDFQRLNGLQS